MERLGEQPVFTTRLVSRRWLAPGILELRLRRPAQLRFLPGQFLTFLMEGYRRDYTMTSAPGDETLDFSIAVVAEGRFGQAIQQAGPECTFHLLGPRGHFIYHGPLHPAVWVATGTGVAPFVAFCRSGVTDALLLHGVRAPERLIHREMLSARLQGYVPCISGSGIGGPGQEKAFSGRVTAYLEQHLAPGTYDFYLCGRRAMIREATAIIDRRFGDARLFIETYD